MAVWSWRRNDRVVTRRAVAHALVILVSTPPWTGAFAQERRIADWRMLPAEGRRITVGSDVAGRLTRRDSLSEASALRLQAWEFEATAGSTLSFHAFSTRFRVYLQVVGDYADHDYGTAGGFVCNVRLTEAIEQSGRHLLIVAGHDSDLTNGGEYRLRMSSDPLEPPELECPMGEERIRSTADLTPAHREGRTTSIGQSTQRSELSNRHPVDTAGARWAVWNLGSGDRRATRVTIIVWSAHFRPVVDVRRPGLPSFRADSTAGRTLGRCSAVLLVTLPEARSSYLLLVTAREPRALGSYSVDVVEASDPRPRPPCPAG